MGLNSVQNFLDNLDNPFDENAFGVPHPRDVDERPAQTEIVVDRNGQPRQAGAALPEGQFITDLRVSAERSLFAFTKGILMRPYLSPVLHNEVSKWAALRVLYRKLLLLPRKHAKTSMISHGLPCHILIQPKDHNIYIPGRAGVDTRILLAGETERRASNNLGTVQAAFEGNRLLRGLWPQCCWENPRKQADKWNKIEMVLPRNIAFPDPTIQAIGVGGAITGARHDVHINDDLVSLEAANSQIVMESAISWFLASRALFDSDSSLEFTIGTRWAANDLYDFIINGGVLDGERFEKDYSVDCVVRSIVENGRVIYPEMFAMQPTPGKIAVTALMKEHGTMFPLLYMNSAADPSLVDFDMNEVRSFKLKDGEISFDELPSDETLKEKFYPSKESYAVDNFTEKLIGERPLGDAYRGMPLNSDTYDILFARQSMMSQPIRKVKST